MAADRAAASTAKPSAIAADRESITRTASGSNSAAASRAESQVPDSSADRCSDTTVLAPPSNAARYTSTNSAGVGREVVTVVRTRSAAQTSAGVTSRPSRPVRPPSCTRSGTTCTPSSSASPPGR